MATIPSSLTTTNTTVAFVANWVGLAANDDGDPFAIAQYTDKTVQVAGAFDGATLVFEGSNNGTDWSTLRDFQGNPLGLTTGGLRQVAEATKFVRPRVVGGGGGVSLAVHVLMKE